MTENPNNRYSLPYAPNRAMVRRKEVELVMPNPNAVRFPLRKLFVIAAWVAGLVRIARPLLLPPADMLDYAIRCLAELAILLAPVLVPVLLLVMVLHHEANRLDRHRREIHSLKRAKGV